MKFKMTHLEERIAPSWGPFQQGIFVGNGGKSKAGQGVILAQQGFGGFGPFQQSIFAGGGKGSKGGFGLILAQQGFFW